MSPNALPLGGLAAGEFFERYWQKRPLLVRGAIPGFEMPVGWADLVRLAGDSEARSRLVLMPAGETSWSARSGPFDAAELEGLPDAGWTLLVHEVDRRVDAVADLLDRFRFVPNWRIDDVMISLAPDGGGVGPHVDRYDVFLLQGHGRRRWRIREQPPTGQEQLVPGAGIRVLAGVEFDRELVLEPGDMLYLPPRIPHEGVALGKSMTCSIGFRAPDPRELCAGFLTSLPTSAFETIRYADPDLAAPEHLGEIPASARARLRESAASLFADGGEFDRWVGCYVTRPLRETRPTAFPGVGSPVDLRRRLESGSVLARSAPPHFAWFNVDDGVLLFVGGESYGLDRGAEAEAELLCGRRRLDIESLGPHLDRSAFSGVVFDLLVRGYLRVVDPADR